LNCPTGMLGDQWLGVGYRTFERRKIGFIAYIAQRDTHVA
jgi:hypothetical protein